MAIPRGLEVERHGFTPITQTQLLVVHFQIFRVGNTIHHSLEVRELLPLVYVIRFKSPDTVGFMCEETMRMSNYVWKDNPGPFKADLESGPANLVWADNPDTSIVADHDPKPTIPMNRRARRAERRMQIQVAPFSGQPYFGIAAWCPDPLAMMPAEEVRIHWEGVVENCEVTVRLRSPMEASKYVKRLSTIRSYIWPHAEKLDLSGKPLDEVPKFSGYGRG